MADFWGNVQPSLTAPLSQSQKATVGNADIEFGNVTRRIDFIGGNAGATFKFRLVHDSEDLEITVPANTTVTRDFRVSHLRHQGSTNGAVAIGYW